MLIFKGAYHLRKHFNNTINLNTLWARSDTGFSNDRLGLKYLKHFNQYTKNQKVGKYRLLVFDSYGSYLTQDFVDYCWQNYIRPFLLPPYLTHILQPLDIRIFQTLKKYFKDAIRDLVFIGAIDVDKELFLQQFQLFQDRTFRNKKLAKSAFKKAGLIPFNPTIANSKLKLFQAQPTTPALVIESDSNSESEGFATPPPPLLLRDNWSEQPTPLSIRSRQRGIDYLDSRIEASIRLGEPLTPTVRRIHQKVEGAAQRSILRGALSSQRVADLSSAAKRRESSIDGRKVVQKYGEIYGHQALRQIEADLADEERVVNTRNIRLSKPWKVKYKRVLQQLLTTIEEKD